MANKQASDAHTCSDIFLLKIKHIYYIAFNNILQEKKNLQNKIIFSSKSK
jgi:hypothetical protein